MARRWASIQQHMTAPEGKKLAEKIKKKGGKDLVAIAAEPRRSKSGAARKPARPNEPVKVLGVEYAGKSYQEKIEELKKGVGQEEGGWLRRQHAGRDCVAVQPSRQ